MAAALASPPSSQTMISSPSLSPPRHHSSDVSSSSDHSDRLTKIPDAQAVDLLKSEEYRQLFRLPSEETCLQDFNCALQENILLQGHMYLFDHYICFYSNIFGFETKKIIPFQDVTSVRRAKTAGIFPNAIEIVAAGKKHFFASFLSRDEAFKLIADGWSQQSNGPEEILDRQESRSEISSHISGDIPAENGHSDYSQVTDLISDDRNLEVSTSRDTQLSPDQVHDNTRSASLGVPNIVEEKQDGAEPSTSQFINWNSEPLDAPEVPKSFTKLAESKFPISVEQFFKLFISDDAAGFIESFHNKCGDKDFRCSSWSPDEGSGYAREKNFLHPIKIYFGAKYGGCKEAQKVQVYRNSHLVIKTSQEVSDVPYADYFTVEGIWDVPKDNAQSEGCILQVFANVDFSKKTMFKGKIEQSTMEECREVYATWIQLAHELLKQKNIEKIEDGALPKTLHDGHSDQQVTGQSAENSVRLDDSVESQKINDNVANFQGTLQQTGSSFQGNLLHATTTCISALREVAVKFSTFLRRQGNLQLFVVMAFFIILLLMQLSIVLLLSRPQPVYVIPQAEQTSTVGLGPSQRAAEAMAWMEKRVHLLKDEMLVVEAQLERMRNEHIMLKAQLRDFEHLHKQQR